MASWNVFSGAAAGICFCSGEELRGAFQVHRDFTGVALGAQPLRGGDLLGRQGGLAVLGKLPAGDQVFTRLAELIEGRQPGVGRRDVAALPGRQDHLGLQVDQLNVLGDNPFWASAASRL